MDRSSRRNTLRRAAAWMVIGSLALCGGCNAISAIAWVCGANMIKGPHNEVMKEKKVAVVCRSSALDQFGHYSAPKDLARAVSLKLGMNVKDIDLIRQQTIEDWIDNNSYVDFVEVGKAVGADLVLGIDIEYFTIHATKNPVLYQGEAAIQFEVIDCRTGKLLASEQLPTERFPRSSRPASEQSATDFTNQYVHFLAEQIGGYFYPTDPHKRFARDADSMP